MSSLTRPVLLPVTEIIEAFVDLGRDGLSAVEEAEVDRILAELVADTARILTAGSHEDFCNALGEWGRDFAELATVLFGGVVAIGGDVSLFAIATLIRSRFKRLGAVLSLAGVIVDHPIIGATIDRQALRDFLLDPPALINETFWDDLFEADDIEGTGRLPAMLLALLLLAPDTVAALRRGELRVAALEPPPVADENSPWGVLRANSRGWIPITFPLRRGDDGRLVLEAFPDLGADPSPEVAMSVLIRSQRRVANGEVVTDFEIWLQPSVDDDHHELRGDSGLVFRLEPGVRSGFGYDGEAGTWNAAVRPRDGATASEASLVLGRETENDQPDLIFGPPFDTRVVVQDLGAELRLRELDEPSVELIGRAEGFGVVLTNRWFRSIGAGSVLREGLRFDLDLAVRLAEGTGFELAAEGGLATRFHVEKQLGRTRLHLKIHSLGLFVPIRASQDHFDTRFEVRAHWSATIGPVTLVMDGAGGWVGWWADEPGGDKECIGLLPPTGVGLQLALPGVTAGGFLDFTGGPNDRYGGVLTVAIVAENAAAPFSVTAFGVHELTGRPGALDRRRSFVVVLGATFHPGAPLGWGIDLIGVGGLVGLDRRADTDALRERLTSGAVGNILFADDPIRNAPVLLGDIAAIFPAAIDVNVYGITLRLGWIRLPKGHFVQLAIGVILEFLRGDRAPSKVIVLGSARARFPPGRSSVLDIQIDVVGIADTVARTFELDATVNKGKLLRIFVLSGDAAVRAGWGDPPYLIASIGGFHPDFHPELAVFPKLARLRLAVDKDVLPKGLSISGTTYLAFTPNTLQFGAQLEVVIKAGSWNVQGKVGGDALVQRDPFFFDVEIHGRVAVRYKKVTLAAVSLTGGLSGPRPTVLRGKVCIEVLFFDACWSDSYQLSSSNVPAGEIVESLVPIVAVELALVANLRMLGVGDEQVLLEPRDTGNRAAFVPLGRLVWEQHRLPLALRVEKIEGNRLAEVQRVSVQASLPSEPVKDWFGIGQFVELDDSEAMTLPSFERHQSGVEIALEQTRSNPVVRSVEVQEIRIPGPPFRGRDLQLPEWVLTGMVAREADTTIGGGRPQFEVDDEVFAVDQPAAATAVSEVDAFLAVGRAISAAGTTFHRADRLVELVL